MFTALAIQTPGVTRWGPAGFPWVSIAGGAHNPFVYSHLIYKNTWMIRFPPEFWYYTVTHEENVDEPQGSVYLASTRRAWRRKIRQAIDHLTCYGTASQRYSSNEVFIVFLSERATAQLDSILNSNEEKRYSIRTWDEDITFYYDRFNSYLQYVQALPIRQQKVSDHETYEEWLTLQT